MIATPQSIQIRNAIDSFCAVWGITEMALMSRNRQARVAECRMGLYTYLTGTVDMGKSDIGRLFGKTHGAVYHGLSTFRLDMRNSTRCKSLYDAASGLSKGESPSPIAASMLIQKVTDLESRVAELEKLLTAKQT